MEKGGRGFAIRHPVHGSATGELVGADRAGAVALDLLLPG
jgi:hypothetical protein